MKGRFAAVTGALLLCACSILPGCTKSSADASSSSSGPSPASGTAPEPAAVASGGIVAQMAAATKRTVDVVANEKGFAPTSIALKKGEPTTLVFKRTTDETCAKEVVFPELKITKELPLNQPVAFDVPVADARTLTFQCGMGMFKGKLIVQ